MRSGFKYAVAGLVLGALAQPASAIEISKHASDSAEVNAIQLKGKIDDGDTFDLQVYISNLPKKPTVVVYLNSPGGNLREGMRLGRVF
jgi:membrane-bound ClpP family serine protease